MAIVILALGYSDVESIGDNTLYVFESDLPAPEVRQKVLKIARQHAYVAAMEAIENGEIDDLFEYSAPWNYTLENISDETWTAAGIAFLPYNIVEFNGYADVNDADVADEA